jgi:hypothetical protein
LRPIRPKPLIAIRNITLFNLMLMLNEHTHLSIFAE